GSAGASPSQEHLFRTLAIRAEFVPRQVRRRNQPIVALVYDLDAVARVLQLEQRDYIVPHKLGSDGSTDPTGELVCAQREVLLDLHDAEPVTTALCLNRKDVVCASPIDAHVYLIRLDLPDTRHAGAKMILE